MDYLYHRYLPPNLATRLGGRLCPAAAENQASGIQANKIAGDKVRDAIAAREAPA